MHNNVSSNEFVLPPELLEEIYKRLVPNDRIRFASVCKAWLSVVISDNPPRRLPLPEPWLMHGHRDCGGYLGMCRFHCLSDNRVYKFNNVVPEDYTVITMSSDGWLLTESPCSSHLKLVNPILNHQMRAISPPPNHSFFDVKSIKKLLVLEPRPTSSAESIDSTFIILPHPWSSWKLTIGYRNYTFRGLGRLDDIVLYEGKLHALKMRETRFGILVFDEEGIRCAHCLVILGIETNSQKNEACLVSTSGDLLLVVRRQPNDLLQTTGFDVYKLPTVRNSGEANAVKLQSLGDHQALFWGSQGCFSVAVEESSPFKEDHIYFVHTLNEQPLTEENGVYSLIDGSIQKPREPPSSTESFWFFPQSSTQRVQNLRPSMS